MVCAFVYVLVCVLLYDELFVRSSLQVCACSVVYFALIVIH